MYPHNHPYFLPAFPNAPYMNMNDSFYRSYPPVNTQIFKASVKDFRLLMQQGSLLLDKLAEVGFETKMMSAAQQGKKQEVDQLIKAIGLKVPVTTKYTPTGINFILHSPTSTSEPISCCSLTVSMKWGF